MISRVTKGVLLEAVISVMCPLAPAGGRLGVEPVGREHHEDEVGVELLLLLFQTAQVQAALLVVFDFHTCKGKMVTGSYKEKGADALL